MKLLKKMLFVGSVLALASTPAMAAFTFVNGDVILGFQATSSTGVDKNVFFNLGSSTVLRDNNGAGAQYGNINTTLSSAFGTNWYSRTDVYFGVIANLNQQPTSGAGSRGQVGGDPSRTFYVSQPTNVPGGGDIYAANAYPSGSLGTAGNALAGLEGFLPGLTTQADGAAILNQATQATQWNNSWTVWNPLNVSSFSTFTGSTPGGTQNNFGKGTPETYVDVQRILATSTGATPAGVVGGGTFEYTVAIGSDGNIRVVPEVSSTLLLGAIGLAAAFQRRRSQLA